MILLLSLSLPGLAQDEVEPTPDVDATPYVDALVDRFMACLADEGTTLADADTTQVTDAIEALAPLASQAGSDCVASAAAVTACADTVRTRSCEDLHDDIRAIFDGRIGPPPPAWAEVYAGALSERVGHCYQVETGAALTASQQADLQVFQNVVGGTLGTMASSCDVRDDALSICTSLIRVMSCESLGERLDGDTSSLVQELMDGCEGWLDCGQLEVE